MRIEKLPPGHTTALWLPFIPSKHCAVRYTHITEIYGSIFGMQSLMYNILWDTRLVSHFFFRFNFIAFVSATMRDVCEHKQFKRENRLIVVDVDVVFVTKAK